jgi:UDP-N-acetylmuramate dehydrogenase
MLLKELSYYKTGGTCDQLIQPQSIQELADAMERTHRNQTDYFLLGAGSNSLIMDDHWPGAVIRFSGMNHIRIEQTRVFAEAGLDNSKFATACYESSLAGVGWMYYLPGQLGATVRMNARCYGGEISGVVDAVTVVTEKGEIKIYAGQEIFFGYKETLFMAEPEIVAMVEFNLAKGDQPQIRQLMDSCKTDREAKQQFLYPSCGCVFKNNYDVGIPSGLLLERANVRRLSTEQVAVSPYHANFVFNKGATANQILEVTLQMREAVYQEYGVWLDYEMEVLGLIPDDLKKRFQEKRSQAFKEADLAHLRTTID